MKKCFLLPQFTQIFKAWKCVLLNNYNACGEDGKRNVEGTLPLLTHRRVKRP